MSYKAYAEAIRDRTIAQVDREFGETISRALKDGINERTGALKESITYEGGVVYAQGRPGVYGFINLLVRNNWRDIVLRNTNKLYLNLNPLEVK